MGCQDRMGFVSLAASCSPTKRALGPSRAHPAASTALPLQDTGTPKETLHMLWWETKGIAAEAAENFPHLEFGGGQQNEVVSRKNIYLINSLFVTLMVI